MGVESAIICDGGAIFIAIMKYLHRHAQDPARKWIPPSAIELDVIQVLCLNGMSPFLVAFIACPCRAWRSSHLDHLAGLQSTQRS